MAVTATQYLQYIARLATNDPGTAKGVITCRLARNDVTPTAASVPGDFTEANFAGYAPVALGAMSYDSENIGGVLHQAANHAAVNFVATAAGDNQTIYCAYWTLTHGATTILVAAQRFTPEQIGNAINAIGDTKSVTTKIAIRAADLS